MYKLKVSLAAVAFLFALLTVAQEEEPCLFSGWDDYLDTWKNRYYTEAKKMYPFGEWFCDTNASYVGKSIGFSAEITVPVYYHGVRHSAIWVGPDGALYFNETTALPFDYIFLNEWPNDNYPEVPDPPFIGPFYSEADFDPQSPGETSQLSYRILDISDTSKPAHQQDITRGMLDHLTQEVRHAVVGANHFTASYGLVVTWYQVKFGGASCGIDDCPRNTYQAVVVLDGAETYSIFNYYDIQWVGGAGKQQCDRYTGLTSSSSPNCSPAHIGFNAGYGRSFTALPYSNHETKTRDIDKQSGSNITGRFIYKVSGDRIVRGGCTNDTSLENEAWPLEIWPMYTDMLGGGAVEISAACFHMNFLANSKCRFGHIERDAIPYEETTMKAKCVPPSLNMIGATNIDVSIDGGNLYRYHSNMLINLLGRNAYGVQIVNPTNDWLNPTQLTITWNPLDLGGDGVQVDVKLMGYREDGEEEDVWQELEITDSSLANSGSYTIQTANVQCGSRNTEDYLCLMYDVGAIQVSVHRDDPNPPRTLSSEIIPLGWYLKTALEAEYGSNWAGYKCQDWDYEEDRQGGWTEKSDLPACPCTFQQALVDWGRFQPDVHCNIDTAPTGGCRYYQGAVHCVLSTFATAGEGSGSRCCYDNDDNLMYAGDSEYGSRSDRAHEWGRWPYEQSPHVPSLSHWVRDMGPWFYCCEWQSNKDDCYNKYQPRRETADCKCYEPPGFAMSFGDPHYTTFDGTSYTFNGHGEFWLLWAENNNVHGQNIDLRIQVRTVQPPPESWGEILATYTTAVTVSMVPHGDVIDNTIVTFMVDEFYEHSDNKLIVLFNGAMLDFREHPARVQEFKDFILVNHDPESAKAATNFTLAYRLGLGVQVAFSNGLIQTIVTLPKEFMDSQNAGVTTCGLLGMWNGDPGDDLRPRDWLDGTVSPDNPQEVHYTFGMSWMVRSDESMFTDIYRAQMDYIFYQDVDFEPIFYPDGSEPPPNITRIVSSYAVRDICGDNEYCYYDYVVTQNEAIALQTLHMQEWANEIGQLSVKVLSCGYLDIQNAIKREPYDYYAGSTVIIEGCREGYNLDGTTQYQCVDKGSDQAVWDPPVSTRCVEIRGGLGTAAIAALAVVAVLVLFFLILFIVICCMCIYKRRSAGKPTKPAEMDSDVIDTSLTDHFPQYKVGGNKPRPGLDKDRSFEIREDVDSSIEKHSRKSFNYDSDYVNDGPGFSPKHGRKQVDLNHSLSLEENNGTDNKGTSKQFSKGNKSKKKQRTALDDNAVEMTTVANEKNAKNGSKEAKPLHSPAPSNISSIRQSPDPGRRIPTGLTPPKTRKQKDYQPVAPYQYPTTSTMKSTTPEGYMNMQKRKPPYQYPNQKSSGYGGNVPQSWTQQYRRPPYAYPPHIQHDWTASSRGYKSAGSDSDV